MVKEIVCKKKRSGPGVRGRPRGAPRRPPGVHMNNISYNTISIMYIYIYICYVFILAGRSSRLDLEIILPTEARHGSHWRPRPVILAAADL